MAALIPIGVVDMCCLEKHTRIHTNTHTHSMVHAKMCLILLETGLFDIRLISLLHKRLMHTCSSKKQEKKTHQINKKKHEKMK